MDNLKEVFLMAKNKDAKKKKGDVKKDKKKPQENTEA